MQLSFDEFQELGVAFKQAPACRHTGQDRIPKAESVDFDDDNQSMQTWKISVQDTVAVLKKKPFKERFDYVREKHLCINCLMPHHMAIDCVSKARCLKCKKKHHYLLHSNSYKESQKQGTKEGHKQTKQDTKVKMVSCLNDSQVHLMTTVVDLVGSNGKRQSVEHSLTKDPKHRSWRLIWYIRSEHRKSKRLT